MVISCQFHGVDARPGQPLGDGWRVLGDISTPLELFHKETGTTNIYVATTKCLKVVLRQLNDTHYTIQGFVSVQNSRIGNLIKHMRFFMSVGSDWPRIESFGDTELENRGGAALATIGSEGFVRLAGHRPGPDELSVKDREGICLTCPDGQFTGDACNLMKCCKRREPDPARWRFNLQSGVCPRGHWSCDKAQTALQYPLIPGNMTVGGTRYITM